MMQNRRKVLITIGWISLFILLIQIYTTDTGNNEEQQVKSIYKQTTALPAATQDIGNISKRWERYCNNVDNLLQGNEGAVAEGYTLRQVLVVTRHGERAPTADRFRNLFSSLSCDVTSLLPGLPEERHARMVRYIRVMKGIRRAPWWSRRMLPYPAFHICPKGGLTARGAEQLTTIGRRLAAAYRALLPATPGEQDVALFTTNSHRSILSGLALLHGAFPDVTDVRSMRRLYRFTETVTEQLCYPGHPSIVCPCHARQAQKWVSGNASRDGVAGERVQELLGEVNGLWGEIAQDVGEVWGLDPGKVPGKKLLTSILLPQYCSSGRLPCSAHQPGRCIKPETLSKLSRIYDIQDDKLRLTMPIKKDEINFRSLPILLDIYHKMKTRANKLVVYSAHDISVTPLLVTLGLKGEYFPPFAARLVFETYTKDDYVFVRVLYNGYDVTSDINADLTDGLLSLQALNNLIQNVLANVNSNKNSKHCNYLK